jgi:hypothetical protein
MAKAGRASERAIIYHLNLGANVQKKVEPI